MNYLLPNIKNIESITKSIPIYKERNLFIDKAPFLSKSYATAEEVRLAICGKDEKDSAKIYASMKSTLRNNKEAMLNLIANDEMAYLYAGENLNNTEFVTDALKVNPLVYGLLSSEQQIDDKIVSAYVQGMNGSDSTKWYPINGEYNTFIAMPQYQIHQNTPMEKYYSVNNYQKAYERIFNESPLMLKGTKSFNSTQNEWKDVYTADVAYIQMAREKMPSLIEEYNKVEAAVIRNNKDKILQRIESRYSAYKSGFEIFMEAALVRCPEMENEIQRANSAYYSEKSKHINGLIDKYLNGYSLTLIDISDIDNAIIQSKQTPEMKIEKRDEYWERRAKATAMIKAEREIKGYFPNEIKRMYFNHTESILACNRDLRELFDSYYHKYIEMRKDAQSQITGKSDFNKKENEQQLGNVDISAEQEYHERG